VGCNCCLQLCSAALCWQSDGKDPHLQLIAVQQLLAACGETSCCCKDNCTTWQWLMSCWFQHNCLQGSSVAALHEGLDGDPSADRLNGDGLCIDMLAVTLQDNWQHSNQHTTADLRDCRQQALIETSSSAVATAADSDERLSQHQ
jgi:hypothetical protein